MEWNQIIAAVLGSGVLASWTRTWWWPLVQRLWTRAASPPQSTTATTTNLIDLLRQVRSSAAAQGMDWTDDLDPLFTAAWQREGADAKGR